jgi:hypothetical protein
MDTRAAIDRLFAGRRLAVAGVSRPRRAARFPLWHAKDGETRPEADPTAKSLLAAAVVLELLVAAAALFGGGALLADPAGSAIGLPAPGQLPGLRFDSYLAPGVLLLLANGILPLFVVAGSLTGRSWAVQGHMIVGMVLTTWTAVQAMRLGWISPLQPLTLVLGVAVFTIGALLSHQQDESSEEPPGAA